MESSCCPLGSTRKGSTKGSKHVKYSEFSPISGRLSDFYQWRHLHRASLITAVDNDKSAVRRRRGWCEQVPRHREGPGSMLVSHRPVRCWFGRPPRFVFNNSRRLFRGLSARYALYLFAVYHCIRTPLSCPTLLHWRGESVFPGLLCSTFDARTLTVSDFSEHLWCWLLAVGCGRTPVRRE